MNKTNCEKNNETGVKKGQKFSDRYLTSLKPKLNPVAIDYIVREGHGFALRVFPNKIKKFYYIYELVPKKQKKLCLGTYISEEDVKNIPIEDRIPYVTLKEAREKFNVYSAVVIRGVDPMAPPEPEPVAPEIYTVEKLIDDYIDNCRKNKLAAKTIYDNDRTLRHDVLPVWGDRSAKDIRRKDAIKLLEDVAERAPGQGRNVLKVGRAMFKYALRRELVDYNPFSGTGADVPVIAAVERTRVLSDDEIRHVWQTLHNKPADDVSTPGTPVTRSALLMTLVTAQRPGEVAGTPKKEISGDWWTIDVARIKTRKKNPYDQRVYMTPLAKSLLPDLENQYCFPTDKIKKTDVIKNKQTDKPITENALSRMISRERKSRKTGLVTRLPYLNLPKWTPHDLRRTAATGLSRLGCSDEIIDAILNHAKEGTISIYNQNKYDKEKKIWLTRWSKHLEKLVSKP